jgi:hypothetical protein
MLSPLLRWGGLALALAALQQLFEGRVNLDDWLFLPIFLAFPCVLGAKRGSIEGATGGLLVGGALLVGSALFPLPEGTVAHAAELPLRECLLAGMALGGMGAMAGYLSARPALVALLPLLWGPGSGLLDRVQLTSPALPGHLALGCVWTALGLGLASFKASAASARLRPEVGRAG